MAIREFVLGPYTIQNTKKSDPIEWSKWGDLDYAPPGTDLDDYYRLEIVHRLLEQIGKRIIPKLDISERLTDTVLFEIMNAEASWVLHSWKSHFNQRFPCVLQINKACTFEKCFPPGRERIDIVPTDEISSFISAGGRVTVSIQRSRDS